MVQEHPAPAGEVTRLLLSWGCGDQDAVNRLFPLVYEEIRALARRQLRRAGAEDTLGTTALVHEAYLKLVDQTRVSVRDRGHFFALAARAMRQILVDYARRRGAAKRGGSAIRATLEEDRAPVAARAAELVAVDEALGKLETLDPRLGRLVELRVFAGLSVEETAQALEVSARTVKRDWHKARAFLYEQFVRTGDP